MESPLSAMSAAAAGGRRRSETRREVSGLLVSAAGLIGRPVRGQDGVPVGRLDDVVVLAGDPHPPVVGYIVRIGPRRVWLHASHVAGLVQGQLQLQVAKFDLQDVRRRPLEIQLYHDVVDHQLVDLHGVQVVRASDLYLSDVGDGWRLVGVDTSWTTFLRRALPGSRGRQPSPSVVLDWAGIHSLAVAEEQGIQLDVPNEQLKLLAPADLADLLGDLGRTERQELLDDLDTEDAADALELMSSADSASVLGDVDVERAAELLATMEPDEAVDALRELPTDERELLLDALAEEDEVDLRSLLGFDEDTAGGMMTSAMITVRSDATVGAAVGLLMAARGDAGQCDVVLLVDEAGGLVDDVSALELLGEDPARPLAELVGPPWPTTVPVDAPLDDVVEAVRGNIGASVVVVDEENRPQGRILADDLVDALGEIERRWPWQRLKGGNA
ncbi:magnesium transporter MgtE N-terminal domain-containing protein [Raineyella sp. W15-4]|uniref:magnesium transporter MgtE N-terminal domain-containing protein n=1 Tax=Raineyella sp. W15-4 TaxID=3081651 RepID=UPI002954DAF0|nr:CBS domain-containing protein [Raineyella sp. W15-4]WOQ17537.1 CBS domain-containing protein [Raineyella sp. W15-4]